MIEFFQSDQECVDMCNMKKKTVYDYETQELRGRGKFHCRGKINTIIGRICGPMYLS